MIAQGVEAAERAAEVFPLALARLRLDEDRVGIVVGLGQPLDGPVGAVLAGWLVAVEVAL